MSKVFREFLKKIGSGTHTGESLGREESAIATRMMLTGEATPAQIGGFMIAHRIKRPTGTELAGMLDAYDELGPKLEPITGKFSSPVLILGSPYDGRSRTAPLSPITALILATAGVAVILHGGDRMPTKEGLPLVEVWRSLGVDWSQVSLPQVQQILSATGLGFVYLPHHFPEAQTIVTYREEIGKRPPFATVELMWCPYAGDSLVVSGFVHPPTEIMMREAYSLRGNTALMTVKGLEGSCDLPRERTALIGFNSANLDSSSDSSAAPQWDRLRLHPHEYGVGGKNASLEVANSAMMAAVLRGEPSELMLSVLWNAGFYLWRSGVASDLSAGMAKAKVLLQEQLVRDKLTELQNTVGK